MGGYVVGNTGMNRFIYLGGIPLIVLASACGGDKSRSPEPERAERELPAYADLGRPDAGEMFGDYPIDAGPEADAAVEVPACCTIQFALPDAVHEGVAARLMGDTAPLESGIALTYAADRWTGEACVPMGVDTIYYYEVDLDVPGSDEPFVVRRFNPNAEQVNDVGLGVVNVVRAVESCEALPGNHSDGSTQ